MNHCVPDWSLEDDLRSFHDLFPASNEKKSTPAPDKELVELLWRNGHVVMQSQTIRKPPSPPPLPLPPPLPPSVCELKQPQKSDPQLKPAVHVVNPGSHMQEDETAQWFKYALEDSFEEEFCSEFLCETPITDTVDASRPNKEVVGEGERNVKCRAIEDGNDFPMPPPKSHIVANQLASSWGNGGGRVNFSHFSRPVKSGSGSVVGMGESSSIRTVGSSASGSNQVQNQGDVSHTMINNGATGVLGKRVKEGGPMISPRDGLRASTFDATMTSSSVASGCSFRRTMGQQSTSNQINKRKGRDGEDSECRSEEAEYESMEADRSAQRPTSTRKSRVAEVHNLSERRRRDKINEKMRALQELIPHCNKSDKASMLDEAIEYLKSLQIQLQLMWMRSGMAPMMFPGVQQYMSRVGIGMAHASMPSIDNLMQLSRAPPVNHTMPSAPPASQMSMCPSPTMNLINFPAQMQNVHLPESYARYFGFPHMQLPPQAMNLYTYGSHMVQQNQTAAVAESSSLPTSGIPRPENLQSGHSGNTR